MTFTISNETKNIVEDYALSNDDRDIERELEHRMSRFGLNPCGR
jgi:hypothetical protein